MTETTDMHDDQPWPWDVDLANGASVAVELYGQELRISRVNATTLRYQMGDDADAARLIGVSETAEKVRFVPTLGPIPLLIFPRYQLLCPVSSTVRCVLRLPLHVQVGIVDKGGVKKLDEIAPPVVSKALYGPVDSGVICTSIHALNGPAIEDIEREVDSFAEAAHPVARRLDADGQAHGEPRSLVAYTYLRARNKTEEPLSVTKVMVPAGVASMYQAGSHIHTNEVSMRLLSAQEAELDFLKCPVPDIVALADLNGERTDTSPKKRHFFAYAYRSKTGLEFGF